MMAAERERVTVFGIDIDRITLSSAASRLADWVETGERSCRYVVTPNLDHALLYEKHPMLRAAYHGASMAVADGWPLVTASRLTGMPLPERVAGSDLVPELFSESKRRGAAPAVFLLGAASGVAEKAAKVIHDRWPNVRVVGTYSPPMGFEKTERENQLIIERVNEVSPDILVVGFGAPKQELWLHSTSHRLDVGVAIAAGATIDFLAGRQTRAPAWVRKIRMEWIHRLLTNPRRLAGRYARNAWQLPSLLLRQSREYSGRLN